MRRCIAWIIVMSGVSLGLGGFVYVMPAPFAAIVLIIAVLSGLLSWAELEFERG